MKKTLLLAMVLVGAFLLGGKAQATVNPWGPCESTGPQCGTDNGTQSKQTYSYADPICPSWYHIQNSGNWNQRCHRDYHWMQPEHKAPTGCPAGYSQSGSDCRKVTVQTQSCKTGTIQYDSCEQEGFCPTECGLEASEVPNGQGGYKRCEATTACVEEPEDVCTNLEGVQEDTPKGYVNNDGICTLEEQEEPKEEPKTEEKENTFHKDTRCHDATPPAPTWVRAVDGSALNGWHPQFTWSAEIGDTVEFRFSENPEDLRWSFMTENDGHEVFGYVENSGILGPVYYYWQMRTVNGCRTGEWSPVLKVFN